MPCKATPSSKGATKDETTPSWTAKVHKLLQELGPLAKAMLRSLDRSDKQLPSRKPKRNQWINRMQNLFDIACGPLPLATLPCVMESVLIRRGIYFNRDERNREDSIALAGQNGQVRRSCGTHSARTS